MKSENKKPGFLKKLFGAGKPKQNSCCCNTGADEKVKAKPSTESPKTGGKSCCCGN